MDNMWVRAMEENNIRSSPKMYSQTINFNGMEDKQGIEILGQDVTVYCSNSTHNHGSSKVKLTNIVDYNWEPKLYMGQLVAVHMSGKYIAYGIKVVQKAAQNIGIVRVASRDSEERALLRGMKGQIQDIAFAFIPNQYILGCVDEEGTLFVHNVDSEGKTIICTLLLHIVHTPDPTVSMYHRILWCPYMPEEDPTQDDPIDDDGAKLLVLTQGCKAEMWNVSQVNTRHGAGPHKPDDIEDGFLEIDEHKLPIIDAAFSPDGTALATASLDGDVKFFQVYMHNDTTKPRCLHQWQPHGGKALSCLFFLDDHHTFIPDVQFWKFAITGCDNNSELKVWSCESWTCLQTIHFKPDPSRPLSTTTTISSSVTSGGITTIGGQISLKAGLDNAAGYLVLSDIQNKILYILQIEKDLNESSAKLQMISEFLLQSPILSFGIIDAGLRKLKCSASTEDLYQLQEGLEVEDGSIVAVTIRMYIVQPKSLQECRIVYQPSNYNSSSTLSLITASNNETNLMFCNDNLPDLEAKKNGLTEQTPPAADSHLITDQPPAPPPPTVVPVTSVVAPPAAQLNLLTPDSFNSPVHQESAENPIVNHTPEKILNNITTAEESNNSNDEGDLIVFNQRNNFASGGSSPSREVQEILSTYPNDFYEEELSSDTKEAKIVDTKIDDIQASSSDNETNTGGVLYTNKFTENDDIEWTKIPIMKVNEVIKSEENRIMHPPSTAVATCVAATTSVTTCNTTSTAMISPTLTSSESQKLNIDNMIDIISSGTELYNQKSIFKKVMSQKLICLEEQIQQQNILLQNLQQQIATLNNNAVLSSSASVVKNGGTTPPISTAQHLSTSVGQTLETNNIQLTNLLTQQIDSILSRNLAEQNKNLENWMFARTNKEREYQEALLSTVSQVIGNNILDKLDTVITQEIQKNVLPQIVNVLELLKRQLHSEMTQKLTSTDHLLKENITKLVQSKAVMDILATSVVGVLRPQLEQSYKETLTNTILPSWERVCQTMFQQIHETFTQGTKEYTVCLETHLEKQRQRQEKGRDLVQQLQGVSDSMRTNSELLANTLSNEIQQQIQKICSSFQETMKKTIRVEVKEQIDRSFRNHAAVLEDSVLNAVKSRAVTPSPHHLLDTQAQIQQLIAQNQYNAAFQLALNASDLSLVVYTCEKINPAQVFSQTPCLLQQNVLLSLIQQLSADMSNHTELKYKYLEEAVMNLQTTNPMTREHMPVVLKELQRQLNAYISCNPSNKIIKQMRMLLMATNSLLIQK